MAVIPEPAQEPEPPQPGVPALPPEPAGRGPAAGTGLDEAIDGPKLLRVQAALFSIVSELRLMTEEDGPAVDSERAHRRLAALEERLLVELGSALPDPLLEELRRDVGGRPVADASEGELRVIAAQLLGWAEGLLAALAVTPPEQRSA